VERPVQPALQRLSQVLSAISPDLRLVAARPMDGGVSATTTYIETRSDDGEHQRFVLRQHGAPPAGDPPTAHAGAHAGAIPHLAAADERWLLARLRTAGLPVPRPRLADESGSILPGPFVVMDFVEGVPVTRPQGPVGFTGQLAATLAKLHDAGVPRTEVAFLPDIEQVAGRKLGTWPSTPDESVSEAAIRAVLAPRWPPPLLNGPTVLHGDYWPGNTLWQNGQLAALIDWEDAAFGDPLADVGNARLELAMAFGADAVEDFTRQYRAARWHVDLTTLPYWDLYAALRPAGKIAGWGLAAADLDRFLAGHREFTRSALQRV
jgi:aminoglycoside phosphotransferase (APT) family kinase protein